MNVKNILGFSNNCPLSENEYKMFKSNNHELHIIIQVGIHTNMIELKQPGPGHT